jgi:hypothetical protein
MIPRRWGVLTPTEQAALALPCTWCDAHPGEWCITRAGGEAHAMHEARWALWRHNERERADR